VVPANLAADVSSLLNARYAKNRYRVFIASTVAGLAMSLFLAWTLPASAPLVKTLGQGMNSAWAKVVEVTGAAGDAFVEMVDSIHVWEVFKI
jgi:hypothetical protein